ncbi:MAG: hypothetical protein GXX85_00640 [Ignavibacteria bacterium]|nr:hypothetical protein [Ignavibacteria bacterium]
MCTRKRDIIEFYNCYFVTTTFNSWLHLLMDERFYKIIIESLKFCIEKYKCSLIAYVLMPNHIHLILFYNDKPEVSGFMRDFKKYTSVKIRQLLQCEEQNGIVEKLKYEKAGQKYKVWQDRFDAVIIRHKNVLITKMKYIHNNPVKNGLVEKAEDWNYSSAGFYVTEKEMYIPVTHAWKII